MVKVLLAVGYYNGRAFGLDSYLKLDLSMSVTFYSKIRDLSGAKNYR